MTNTLRIRQKYIGALVKAKIKNLLGTGTSTDPCDCCNCAGRQWYCLDSPKVGLTYNEVETKTYLSCCSGSIPRILMFTILCDKCGCLDGRSGRLEYIGDLPHGPTWSGAIDCICGNGNSEVIYFNLYCYLGRFSFNATGCANDTEKEFEIANCEPLYLRATNVQTNLCCNEDGKLIIEVTE